jgi:hypothetical protein
MANAYLQLQATTCMPPTLLRLSYDNGHPIECKYRAREVLSLFRSLPIMQVLADEVPPR